MLLILYFARRDVRWHVSVRTRSSLYLVAGERDEKASRWILRNLSARHNIHTMPSHSRFSIV